MWQQAVEQYACRVGHRLSFEELMIQQYTSLQSALWLAVRSLEERSAIQRQVAKRHHGLGHAELAAVAERQAHAAVHAAELIREVLTDVTEEPHAGTQ